MSTIRYIGNKRSLLDWLVEAFNLSNVNSFADVMSGTGIVAYTVSKAKPDCQVFSNDICVYSSLLQTSLMKPFNQELYDKYFAVINDASTVAKGFINVNYSEGSEAGRMYFTDFNGQRINGARLVINNATDLDSDTRNALIATVLIGADKVANTTGVYCSYLKKFNGSSSNRIKFERTISTTFRTGTYQMETHLTLLVGFQR